MPSLFIKAVKIYVQSTLLKNCLKFDLVSYRVQILNGSTRNLTPSHTTRDAFMNLSLAFSRDVSLGRLWLYS